MLAAEQIVTIRSISSLILVPFLIVLVGAIAGTVAWILKPPAD